MDQTSPHYTNDPEGMDRPEMIATILLLRTHLESANRDFKILNQRCWQAEGRVADLRMEQQRLEDECDASRAEVVKLTALLECARGDRDTEESMRSALESRITSELSEANRAIGYAALRLLALVDSVQPH